MSLEGKVVVISGAGTGIGAHATKAMRAAGACVVLNGRRADKLEQVASSVDPDGKNVACVAGDIGDPKTSVRVVKTAIERFGGVDVLFNNAGIFEPKPFLQVSQEDLRGYFNLMGGYFALTQSAVRQMKKRGGGAVISIGSIWAMQGIAATPSSAPSMAKGGTGDVLTGLTAGLIAQTRDIGLAVRAAVWLHGRAGELAAEELTEYCVLATDLLTYLPRAIREVI